MIYTITDGSKAEYINAGHEFSFEADADDIDTAYDALAENLKLNNDDDLIDFQDAKDDDVKTLLDDMKRMGFIDSYEAEEA